MPDDAEDRALADLCGEDMAQADAAIAAGEHGQPLDEVMAELEAGAAFDVVKALAAADPVYDTVSCFFCGALAPTPPINRGPAWTDDSEVHQDDCPWWMARQLLGLPSWPPSTTC